MSTSFDCMMLVSELPDMYTRASPYVQFYPTGDTVVHESSTMQLLGKAARGKIMELDMTDRDIHTFLKNLANDGSDVTEEYEGVAWTFKKQ